MIVPKLITLISYTKSIDADGYETKTPKETQVFSNVSSVKHSEFYEAMQAGIRPSVMATVYVQEYNEAFSNAYAPEHCLMDGILYRIVREYQTDIDHTQLTLEKEMRQ